MGRGLSWITAVCALATLSLAAQQNRDDGIGTALLAGRVIDREAKTPLVGARVTLLVGNQAQREITTGRDGTFVFPKIPAGTYEVHASLPGYLRTGFGQKKPDRTATPIAMEAGERRSDVVIAMFRGGTISGRVTGENSIPLVAAQVQIRRLRHFENGPSLQTSATTVTDDRGAYRVFGLAPGQYYVQVVPSSGVVMHVATPRWDVQPTPAESYVRTFYPAVETPTEATPLVIDYGDDLTGIDIVLSLRPLTRIRGRLIAPSGFIGGEFTRISDDPLLHDEPLAATTSRDGTFVLIGVAPGQFTLAVHAYTAAISAGGERLWGTVRVAATGGEVDVTGIPLRNGLTISGGFRADGDARTPRPKDGFSASAQGVGPVGSVQNQVIGSKTDENGRFRITGLMPGRYRLYAAGGLGIWQLSSAIVQGQDSGSTSLDLQADLTDVMLVLTDSRASLAGSLLTTGESRASDYTVVLFPADPSVRSAIPRVVSQAAVSTTGRYRIEYLLPGKYLIAVTDDIEQFAWYDPRVLEQLAERATPVTILAREDKVLDLRIR